jgi:hypothetical protein
VIEAMVPMCRELGLAVTFSDLNFPFVQKTFNDEGKLLDQAFEREPKTFLTNSLDEHRLEVGRANIPSKFSYLNTPRGGSTKSRPGINN